MLASRARATSKAPLARQMHLMQALGTRLASTSPPALESKLTGSIIPFLNMSRHAMEESATELVAVFMTPTWEAAYCIQNSDSQADDDDAPEAALKQLELSTNRAERALDAALLELRAA